MLLKRNLHEHQQGEQNAMMDRVIHVLSHAVRARDCHLVPLSSLGPQSALDHTWKKLLFSPDFSDVKFVCPGGTTIQAHRNVLAASSDYFRTYFLGPWGENHPDGVWETTHSAVVISAVLTFIYTGSLPRYDKTTVESCPNCYSTDLLRVAHEYNLVQLIGIAEANCIRNLSTENIESTLLLARLYGSRPLEKACMDFVRRNATTVLTKLDFMALATQDPDLWDDLSQAIDPDHAKKRKREEV